jgi:hypothetical protein
MTRIRPHASSDPTKLVIAVRWLRLRHGLRAKPRTHSHVNASYLGDAHRPVLGDLHDQDALYS